MLKNVGKRDQVCVGEVIQLCAVIGTIIGILASIIGAAIYWFMFEIMMWIGALILFGGCLIFFMLGLLMYGFGKLIKNSTIAVDLLSDREECEEADDSVRMTTNSNF